MGGERSKSNQIKKRREGTTSRGYVKISPNAGPIYWDTAASRPVAIKRKIRQHGGLIPYHPHYTRMGRRRLEETLDILKDPECTPEYYEEDDEDESARDG